MENGRKGTSGIVCIMFAGLQEVLDISGHQCHPESWWKMPVLGPHPTALRSVAGGEEVAENLGFSRAPHWHFRAGGLQPLLRGILH